MSRLIDADRLKQDWLFRGYDSKPYRDVIDSQPTIMPERKWIPCSERLSADETQVFVYLFGDSPYIAWMSKGRWYTDDFEVDEEDYPTAWMPLPEPYKEDKEDE